MRIHVTSVFVDDQEKALEVYTRQLGFVKKADVPVGDARWLTVVSPDEPDGVELLLEPNAHPAARAFQETLLADGIPLTSFAVDDVRAEVERLRRAGLEIRQEPTAAGPVTVATFADGCGNLIQIVQK